MILFPYSLDRVNGFPVVAFILEWFCAWWNVFCSSLHHCLCISPCFSSCMVLNTDVWSQGRSLLGVMLHPTGFILAWEVLQLLQNIGTYQAKGALRAETSWSTEVYPYLINLCVKTIHSMVIHTQQQLFIILVLVLCRSCSKIPAKYILYLKFSKQNYRVTVDKFS